MYASQLKVITKVPSHSRDVTNFNVLLQRRQAHVNHVIDLK